MKSKLIGVLILAAIVIVAIYYSQMPGGKALRGKTALKGEIGGEKQGFCDDPAVQKMLGSRFGISLDFTKAGSIEMVSGDIKPEFDFLWPSSQVALELFKINHADKLVKSEIIFNSPIVLYTWDIVADALQKNAIVEKLNESYFITDFPKLIALVLEGKKWTDIGLQDLFGKISIITTDPTKSNSGAMFAALLANTINRDVVEEQSIDSILPVIKTFFSRLGYMEHSSGDLFEQYLRTGVGAKPVIVGYESQIVEFSLQHKELWPKVKDKIRILYPIPTVWASHPVIVLTEQGKKLAAALQDKEVLKTAWERHGFRSGLIGVENDPKVLDVVGIPENITKVVPMPSPAIMEKIIKATRTP